MTTVEDTTIIGDGSQNVVGTTVSGDIVQQQLRFVRGRPSMFLSDAVVTERVAGYVPALNHSEIVETLRRERVAALAGTRGAGAMTTAIAAMRYMHPDLPMRYLATDHDDMEEIKVAAAHGYLVRAGDEGRTRLWNCVEAVRASRGFLLVVGDHTEFEGFREFLNAIPVQPPPADAVYRHRLRCRGLGDTAWADWPLAAELLKDALPGHGHRLAELVVTAVAESRDGEEIERAYRGWREQLRDWFREHPDPRERTLLVAAATITPAGETSVYDAALALARQLEVQVAGGGLAWVPTTGLTSLLTADLEHGDIVFRRQGFAESVLHHVWAEYPLARTDLLVWLSKLVVEGANFERWLRIRLAEVFADLAATHGTADMIGNTARVWAGLEDQGGADLAHIVLSRTCLHPLVGGRVRRKLYDWSRERTAPQTLKLTVVRTCQVLGETYPSIAMTRLQHLATQDNNQLRGEVVAAARELAELHRQVVFDAALKWCEDAPTLSGRDGVRRAHAGLKLLLLLVLDGVASNDEFQKFLLALDGLAAQGDERLRPIIMEAVRELAARYRLAAVQLALKWAQDSASHPLKANIGTEAFLEFATDRDGDGNASMLTGTDPVDPASAVSAWWVALAAEPVPEAPGGPAWQTRRQTKGYDGLEEAVRLWLDTAQARRELRPGIVAGFVQAAGYSGNSQVVVELTRRWAGSGSDRKAVRDDVLMQLLQPEWRRILLVLWVRLRQRAARDR